MDISTNMVDPKTGDYDELPHIGPGNIESFTGILSNVRYVREENLISSKFHFRSGDIIYGKIRPNLAKYVLIDFEGLASADAYVLNSKSGLEQSFLYRILQNKDFYDYSVSVSQRTGMPKINREELNQYKFLMPCSKEQIAIGIFFRTLDDTITLHKRKLSGLRELRKGYLQQMFPQAGEREPRVRFAGFIGDWDERKIGEICNATFGGGTPSTTNDDFWNGDLPWLQSSNLTEHDVMQIKRRKHISVKGVESSSAKLVPANSIAIVTRVGVGKLCVIPFQYATSQDFISLSDFNINTWFGVYVIYSKLQKELNAVQGTSIKGVTKDELLNKIISVSPSLSEQTVIGNFFLNLDEQITAQATKLEQLRQLKAAYLQRMFI